MNDITTQWKQLPGSKFPALPFTGQKVLLSLCLLNKALRREEAAGWAVQE
jgi:hypothetical protein